MLRYIYADSLDQFPRLADQMFRDRAGQFKTRLGWDVTVDAKEHERDENLISLHLSSPLFSLLLEKKARKVPKRIS